VQNSLCVQTLRSPVLAALLHGTRVVGVSQTLRRGTDWEYNYGTFAPRYFQQSAAIMLGITTNKKLLQCGPMPNMMAALIL